MPTWLQHTLVLGLVATCLGLVFRDALRALRNQASKLAGCGSCKGCSTEPKQPQSVTDSAAPATPRVAFIPSDALTARAATRRQQN